jgi:hypothetical protein
VGGTAVGGARGRGGQGQGGAFGEIDGEG